MDWELRIPHHGDRDALVLDTISAARETLGEDEQRMVEAIATDCLPRGIHTVGQLLDGLEQLTPAETRALLDRARTAVGLPTTGEVEKRRADAKFEAAFQRLQPPDPPRWSPLQRCAVCGTYPMGESGWKPVSVEKWHCPAHEAMAEEGDMAEHEPAVIGLSPSGAPVYSSKERRRRAEWLKKDQADRERERRQREEHDRAVAETMEAAKQHYADTAVISVAGIRTRPDGRVV